jgi:hypothetical protein
MFWYVLENAVVSEEGNHGSGDGGIMSPEDWGWDTSSSQNFLGYMVLTGGRGGRFQGSGGAGSYPGGGVYQYWSFVLGGRSVGWIWGVAGIGGVLIRE